MSTKKTTSSRVKKSSRRNLFRQILARRASKDGGPASRMLTAGRSTKSRFGAVKNRKSIQRAMCCPCGREKILALGVCATCYTLHRQDEEYYGGHREEVLARDGYRCCIPGCYKGGTSKRTLAVHHRESGNSNPERMITLCLAHHAMVTRTEMLSKNWPDLLRVLWREQHPEAHEQTALDFTAKQPVIKPVPLFRDDGEVLE